MELFTIIHAFGLLTFFIAKSTSIALNVSDPSTSLNTRSQITAYVKFN
jgi:hypothetical protein